MQTKNSTAFYFLLVLCPVLLMIILFQNCKRAEPVNSETSKARQATNNRFCDTACLGSSPTFIPGRLDYNTARMMANAYAADEGKYYVWNGGQRTGEQDSRYVWYDLKRLKQFIALIEGAMCRSGCSNNTSLGIRFYFAKYPERKDMGMFPALYNVPYDYALHHTFFMVPTFWDPAKGINVDFDPAGLGTSCSLEPLDPVKGGVYLATGPSDGGGGQNHGGMRPPPPEDGEIFPTTDN